MYEEFFGMSTHIVRLNHPKFFALKGQRLLDGIMLNVVYMLLMNLYAGKKPKNVLARTPEAEDSDYEEEGSDDDKNSNGEIEGDNEVDAIEDEEEGTPWQPDWMIKPNLCPACNLQQQMTAYKSK